MSERAAARHFGIDRKTVSKILKHSVPPGYRRAGPPVRPKLDPFVAIIDQILEDDRSQLKKQRHTAKRIFERLRDEHGFTGKLTIVTDYVREKKRRMREAMARATMAGVQPVVSRMPQAASCSCGGRFELLPVTVIGQRLWFSLAGTH